MDDQARNKLIADHLEMATAIASDCATKFNLLPLVPHADLVGYAHQGLVEAASRYSPESGTKFRTYSWTRIRGAVIDGVRKSSRQGYSRSHSDPDHAAPEITCAPHESSSDCVDDLPDAHSLSTSPEQSADAQRLREILLRAIAALPSRDRDITLRHYYRGQDLLEISKEYGYSDAYVSRLHARCLRQLRATLGDSLRDHLSPPVLQ